MQPLKSNGTDSPSNDGAVVVGGELHLVVLMLASELSLSRERNKKTAVNLRRSLLTVLLYCVLL
jgi:hypothetical protein